MKYGYKAVIAPCEYQDGYLARIPDLPGCAAIGADFEEAVKNITSTAETFLAESERLGLPALPADYEDEPGIRGEGTRYETITVNT